MLQPGAAFGTPLIAQALHEPGEPSVARHDDPALAGRHLLVRIERERRGRTEAADPPAAILGAQGLAGIVDEREPMALGIGR